MDYKEKGFHILCEREEDEDERASELLHVRERI